MLAEARQDKTGRQQSDTYTQSLAGKGFLILYVESAAEEFKLSENKLQKDPQEGLCANLQDKN